MYLCRFCPGPSVPWLRWPHPRKCPTSPRRVREVLTEEQRSQLAELLTEFQDVFARSEFNFWSPGKEMMRRTPALFAGEEEAHLKKMLDAGVIQPFISEWASAPVMIMKKDGQVRWCLDYRRLNNVTRRDLCPLPLIDECLDTLSGSVWFSKLVANSTFCSGLPGRRLRPT